MRSDGVMIAREDSCLRECGVRTVGLGSEDVPLNSETDRGRWTVLAGSAQFGLAGF